MKLGYSEAGDCALNWQLSFDGAVTGGCTAGDVTMLDIVSSGVNSDGFATNPIDAVNNVIGSICDYDLVHIDLHKARSALLDTYLSKRSDRQRNDLQRPYFFVVVKDKSDSSTWELHCVKGMNTDTETYSIDATGFDSETAYTSPQNHLLSILPTVSVTAGDVSADGYADVTVTLSEGHDTELYLEAVNGYLPKTRVTTSGLTATFKVGALGLDAGDTVRVKIGFKRVTGVADAELSVVNA